MKYYPIAKVPHVILYFLNVWANGHRELLQSSFVIHLLFGAKHCYVFMVLSRCCQNISVSGHRAVIVHFLSQCEEYRTYTNTVLFYRLWHE